MAKFEVNGQIFKFSKKANGHVHSPNRQNSNRRMASQNYTDPYPIRTWPSPFFEADIIALLELGPTIFYERS